MSTNIASVKPVIIYFIIIDVLGEEKIGFNKK
jgi:hypothetical protein